MSTETSDKIVIKSSDIDIQQFNESNEYIITQKKLGNRVVINPNTFAILELVDNKSSLQQIVENYNSKNPDSPITIEIADKVLFENLGKYGIIINNSIALQEHKTANYLTLSFTVIHKKYLKNIIKLLAPLFVFKHFYKIFFIGFAFVGFTLLKNKINIIKATESLHFSDVILILICTFIIMFFHEFGHATSAKKLGAEPDHIGFGFYLLRPVMFADVSDVWKLKAKERIYVNLAGLYIEVIIASVLCLGFFFTKNTFLLLIASTQLASFFMNLNPFFRYDGYWVLSDITNTPNLRKVSNEKVKSFLNSLLNKGRIELTTKTIFLIFYGIISSILIFVFIGWILIKDPNSIIAFPINVFNFLRSLISGENGFNLSELKKLVLPFIFYFILIKVYGRRSINFIRKKLFS